MPQSTVDFIPSLDVAASVDPVVVSQDVEFRRTTTQPLQVRNASGAAGAYRAVWDTTNGRYGFSLISGTFAPLFDWHFEAEGGGGSEWTIDFYGANAENFCLGGRKAQGTKAAPTALTDDSDMWEFAAMGFDGVAFSGQQAVILFEAAGAWSGTAHGTRQVFKVTDRTDITVTQHETMVLADDFCVIITGGVDGFTAAFAGEILRVEGDARIDGKLTVTGAIDPTSVLLSDPAAGTAIFFESNNGATAPIAGAATGRIRYNNALGFWQVSMQGGAYQNIATVASGGGTLAFVQGGNSFGATAVLGTNDAFDLELERGGVSRVSVGAATFDLLAGGALSFSIGGVVLFEADRDLAVTLTPNADSTISVGTASRRFVNVVGNNHQVFAALGDANPVVQLSNAAGGAVLFGAGGASALDYRYRRTGAAAATVDNNAGGAVVTTHIGDYLVQSGTATAFRVQDAAGLEHLLLDNATHFFRLFNNGGANPVQEFMFNGTPYHAMGPGGGTALDVALRRNAAGIWQMDASAGGVVATSTQLWVRSSLGADYAAVLRLTGEAAASFQGGYIQYDGTPNELIIGVHDTANELTASDIEVIRFTRATGVIGILTAPVAGQAVSFGGNLRMVGDFDFTPSVDNTGELGTDALRWTRVRAVSVVTGDLELKADGDDPKAWWTVRESEDCVYFINRKNGKKYKAVLEEVAA